MSGRVSALKTVISFTVFKQSTIKLAFGEKKEKNSFELGRSITEELNSEKARLLILFSSGSVINPNELLDGVSSVNPKLPVAGGVAGNNITDKQGFVFCNNKITDHGVVGIVLEGESLLVNQYYHLCWTPIGKEMTITKADYVRVYTIDNIPAYQVYKKYLGVERKTGVILNSIFPLISQRHGVECVRVPIRIHDDDSLGFSGDLFEGEKVRFSFGQVEMILSTIDKLIQQVKKVPAESIFVYSCTSRRGFLQDYAEVETLPLQEIACTSGFFTNGEFYHSCDTNQVLNATMTTLVLSESAQNEKGTNQNQEFILEKGKTKSKYDIEDNVKSGGLDILKSLTNLVNMVTNELKDRTVELEVVNEKVRYDSLHDALTGLYNRNFYNQEIIQLQSVNEPLGIIVCDVDGLKSINDKFGHYMGDEILKATSAVISSLTGSTYVAARVGGDEFVILINNCSQKDVEGFYSEIQERVAEYNKERPLIPLSISIGFSIYNKTYKSLDESFKEADNNMYLEKRYHKMIIRGDCQF